VDEASHKLKFRLGSSNLGEPHEGTSQPLVSAFERDCITWGLWRGKVTLHLSVLRATLVARSGRCGTLHLTKQIFRLNSPRGVAFFGVLAAIPGLAAGCHIVGLLGDPGIGVGEQIKALRGVAPDAAMNAIHVAAMRLLHRAKRHCYLARSSTPYSH